MKAAIYCRVSTEDQEREGTSLNSQLETCVKLARERGYEVPESYCVMETYSGLSLDRPKLNQVREWARSGELDVVIAYTLDRLSRDPVHFIILQDELKRAGVDIVLVTETLDSSDMGLLITYIKGYAAKLEAEKIKERTTRGLKERAKAGKFPSGWRGRLYGYDYLRDTGKRCANEIQAQWVRQIFHWFVNEGTGIDRITYKLRELDIPAPSGQGLWYSSEVWKILRNRAYIGETYVFTCTKRTRKPKAEWIELPNATPAIIDKDIFEAAQVQLKRNKARASRNTKHLYLLASHIFCQRCNRKFWGFAKQIKWGGTYHLKRYYRCAGNLQMVSPIRCGNHNLPADKIESMAWHEVESLLSNPTLILNELEQRRAEAGHGDFLEQEILQVTRRLKSLDREQGQLLQWALKGFPEDAIATENEKINQVRNELQNQRAELERRIDEARQREVDMSAIEQFCKSVGQNLASFTYEDKRMALEALQIKVLVDGNNVSMTGAIPIPAGDIVSILPA
jgi:site-specific DNA recombinase